VADMTTDSAHRGVRLERIENSKYVVTNDRGGQIRTGKGQAPTADRDRRLREGQGVAT
jgi:hypothetical protein